LPKLRVTGEGKPLLRSKKQKGTRERESEGTKPPNTNPQQKKPKTPTNTKPPPQQKAAKRGKGAEQTEKKKKLNEASEDIDTNGSVPNQE